MGRISALALQRVNLKEENIKRITARRRGNDPDTVQGFFFLINVFIYLFCKRLLHHYNVPHRRLLVWNGCQQGDGLNRHAARLMLSPFSVTLLRLCCNPPLSPPLPPQPSSYFISKFDCLVIVNGRSCRDGDAAAARYPNLERPSWLLVGRYSSTLPLTHVRRFPNHSSSLCYLRASS